jgi:hypothetical protein
MVFWTSVPQSTIWNTNLHNETYRSKYGYKEMEVHNPPPRRNKDFKPALYGDYLGMPNYKMSYPYSLLKLAKDLWYERHNFTIQYIKAFILGSFGGALFGSTYFMLKDQQDFVAKKLYLTLDKGAFSFKHLKLQLNLLAPYALYGGLFFFAYTFLFNMFTMHREALGTPKCFTHAKVWALMSPIVAMACFGPGYIVHGFVFGMLFLFPLFYSLKNVADLNGTRVPHVYYQEGVSQAEKDKYEYQDRIETIAADIQHEFCYKHANKYDQTGGSY